MTQTSYDLGTLDDTSLPYISVVETTAGDDDPATDEVQTVTLVNATGGTWTLTYDDQTTTALAYGASAAAVDAALEALSNIGVADVAVVKTLDAYEITFGTALGDANIEMLTADASGLTGDVGTAPVIIPADAPNGVLGITASSTTDGATIVVQGRQRNSTIVSEASDWRDLWTVAIDADGLTQTPLSVVAGAVLPAELRARCTDFTDGEYVVTLTTTTNS